MASENGGTALSEKILSHEAAASRLWVLSLGGSLAAESKLHKYSQGKQMMTATEKLKRKQQ